LIQAGYRGQSLGIINQALAGRAAHPVEFYLHAWRRLGVIGGAVLIACILLIYPRGGAARGRRTLAAWLLGGEEDLDARSLLWLSVVLGSIGGFAEAGYLWIRQVVTHRTEGGFHTDLLWLAPLSSALAALLVATGLWALVKAGGTRIELRKAILVFGFFAIYGVVQSPGIPLFPIAEILLSLGLAAALARTAAAHGARIRRLIAHAPVYFGGAFGLLAIVAILNLPAVAERRAQAGRPEASSDLPNVLLIILDTVRAGNLSLYGYDRRTTPRIDEWSRSGVVFDRAYSTASWTLPSHASMFTGRYHFELMTGPGKALDDTYPTLAGVLARHGYATAGFVANLEFTTKASGLNRGFDRYEDYPVSMGALAKSSWLSRMTLYHIGRMAGWKEPGRNFKDGDHVTAEFVDWLDERRTRPFFAFLNYFEAHGPYEAPEPYSTAFGPRSRRGSINAHWRPRPESEYSVEQVQPWLNMYDGALSYLDHQIGVILKTLEAREELANTLVVIASDHGEMWGEHGEIGHLVSLYEPVLHVPLVISFPGHVPENVRIAAPVSLRDLPVTILDLVGLSEASPISGTSMVPLWTPDMPGGKASVALAEVTNSPLWSKPFWAPVNRGDMAALFSDGLHYILNGDGLEELYDLGQDPKEANDLAERAEFQRTLG